MTPEELEDLWRDPRSWRGGVIYFRREDPRVIVPKRTRWTGYTMNFAQPLAAPVLLVILVLVVVPWLLPFVIDLRAGTIWGTVTFFIVVALLVAACRWESHRSR